MATTNPATFAAAISCIDGRVQLPVTLWMRERFSVDYVDVITYPGVDGLFADHADLARERLRPMVELSVRRHFSEIVAVTAHHDCLGNPVAEDVHRGHLARAVREVRSWNLSVKIVALWVNATWQVDVVQTRSDTR